MGYFLRLGVTLSPLCTFSQSDFLKRPPKSGVNVLISLIYYS